MAAPGPDPDLSFPPGGPLNPALFPTPELLNTELPQYEFRHIIGTGGMGAVYLARQPAQGREVAVKVMPAATVAADADAAELFNTEARSMARLSHPHIVAVYDFGQTPGGHLFMAMEYVDGADLHWRTQAGEVTPERARTVIAQLCDALHYAHAQGVIHRDIKPANILISQDWAVKLADFGLAKDLSGQNAGVQAEYGTPDYVAPERLMAGETVDHRADIYSLGVVIHEILTGRTPRAAGLGAGQGLPDAFVGVLSKCLMKDQARRYQSAGEVKAALLQATREQEEAEAAVAAPAVFTPVWRPPGVVSRPPPPAPVQVQNGPAGSVAASPRHSSAAPERKAMLAATAMALAVLAFLVWRDHFQPGPPARSEPVKVAAAPGTEEAEAPIQETAKPEPESGEALTAEQSVLASGDNFANKTLEKDVNPQPPVMNKAIPAAFALSVAAVSPALSVDFQSQIAPIFKAKCYKCHSEAEGKEKGDLALDTEAKLKATIGPDLLVIPGQPEDSKMLTLCKLPDDDSDVMPPNGKNRLTAEELTLLETWIKEGASLTGGGAAPAAAPAMAPAAAAPTSWTSTEGKTIEATFVALNGDQITLNVTATGKEFTFPLSRLSPESQAQAKAAAGQ